MKHLQRAEANQPEPEFTTPDRVSMKNPFAQAGVI
jgi:hypothetical protein